MILNHRQLTAKQTSNLQAAVKAPAMRRAGRLLGEQQSRARGAAESPQPLPSCSASPRRAQPAPCGSSTGTAAETGVVSPPQHASLLLHHSITDIAAGEHSSPSPQSRISGCCSAHLLLFLSHLLDVPLCEGERSWMGGETKHANWADLQNQPV